MPRKTTTPRPSRAKKPKEVSRTVEELYEAPPDMEIDGDERGAPQEDEAIQPFHINSAPRFYRTIAITFLIAAVAVAGFVYYFTASKAEISLTLKPRTVKVDAVLGVAAKPAGKDQIAGTVVSLPLTLEKEFSVSAGNEIPAQATGFVTLYNKNSKDQPLRATTQLMSDSGVLFRLKNMVTVPAGGTLKAEVYADEPGPEGEIGPAAFTIIKLAASLQKLIYAQSTEKMLGGTSHEGVLTDQDIKNAKDELLSEISASPAQFAGKTLATTAYSGALFSIDTDRAIVKTSAKAGDKVSSFKMSAVIPAAAVMYNKEDAVKYASQKLQEAISDDEVLADDQAQSAPSVQIQKYDLTAKTADLRVTEDALVRVNAILSLLNKAKILGQTKIDVESYLRSLPWVEKINIKTWPSWLKSLPKEMDKVEVKIGA